MICGFSSRTATAVATRGWALGRDSQSGRVSGHEAETSIKKVYQAIKLDPISATSEHIGKYGTVLS